MPESMGFKNGELLFFSSHLFIKVVDAAAAVFTEHRDARSA